MIDENTWIISDNHFGHERCHHIFEPMRYETAMRHGYNDFEDLMVDRWNAKINPSDSVLIVGDLCINKKDREKTLENIKKCGSVLNGEKYILFGNHDLFENTLIYVDNGIIPLYNLIIDGTEIRVSEKRYSTKFPFIIFRYNSENILISHLPAYPITSNYKDVYLEEKKYLLNVVCKDFKIDRNIHGHTHNHCFDNDFFINISIDALDNYYPKRIKDVLIKKTKGDLYG